MIKVSVRYPCDDQSKFDWDYYRNRHIPMVLARLGAAVHRYSVERGMPVSVSGVAPNYKAMAHLLFESVEALHAAYAPHLQSRPTPMT
jgi:uncharacterized protein (TIGR02118 family)